MFKKKKYDDSDLANRKIREEHVADKNKKSRSFIWIMGTSILLIGGLILIGLYLGYTHPYFTIDNIVVSGNKVVTDEQIIEAAAVPKDQNILKLDASSITAKVEALDNISNVKTTKVLPDTLKITLTESTDFGYIHVDKGYLIVSGDLVINRHEPELKEKDKSKLIKISNASYSTLAIGYKVSEDKNELEFIRKLIDQELVKVTKEIDFGNKIKDLKMKVNQDTIIDFGKIDDLDYKFSLIEKIMVDLKSKGIKSKEIILNGTSNPVIVTD